MKLIGVSGTNGSGKDTLAHILAADGWIFISLSDILRQELKKRGLPIERKHLRALSAEWRKAYHHGHLIDLAVEDYKKNGDTAGGLVVSSIRNTGEAERIHELGGKVVWIDANPRLRYQRIQSRLRSTEDYKTLEQFLQEEKDEMEHNGDEHGLHMAGVKAKADIFITNDFDNLEDFKHAAQKALNP